MISKKIILAFLSFAALNNSIFALSEKNQPGVYSNYKEIPYKPYEIKIKRPELILGGILASTVAGSIFLGNYSAETIPGKIFASIAWFASAELVQNGLLFALCDIGMIKERNNEVYLRL